MSSSSKTNWERVDALTDQDIDISDSPPLTEEFFAKATWLMPGESLSHQTVKVELGLDPKILAWFQAQGQDYETRMLAALRIYDEAHQPCFLLRYSHLLPQFSPERRRHSPQYHLSFLRFQVAEGD